MRHPSLGVPRRILVHHTASARTTTYEDVDRWHREHEPTPFRMIGYHYFIPDSGQIQVGRPLPELGAHCKRFNFASIGICLAGDNTNPAERWSVRQVGGLTTLLDSLFGVWPWLKDEVYGHKDYAETECPGLDVRALLAGSLVVG
jgi:N-acetylmuramoyl-L-alanine amidase